MLALSVPSVAIQCVCMVLCHHTAGCSFLALMARFVCERDNLRSVRFVFFPVAGFTFLFFKSLLFVYVNHGYYESALLRKLNKCLSTVSLGSWKNCNLYCNLPSG